MKNKKTHYSYDGCPKYVFFATDRREDVTCRLCLVKMKVLKTSFDPTKPRKGTTVRVIRGRNIPLNTIGKVLWYGATAPTQNSWWDRWYPKVCLEVVDEMTGRMELWTAAKNVEVIKQREG